MGKFLLHVGHVLIDLHLVHAFGGGGVDDDSGRVGVVELVILHLVRQGLVLVAPGEGREGGRREDGGT